MRLFLTAVLALTLLFTVTAYGKQKFTPESDFKYIKSDGTVKISGYTGEGGAVNIPPTLGGILVFQNNGSGRKIYVPVESLKAYKNAINWSEYSSSITGYSK